MEHVLRVSLAHTNLSSSLLLPPWHGLSAFCPLTHQAMPNLPTPHYSSPRTSGTPGSYVETASPWELPVCHELEEHPCEKEMLTFPPLAGALHFHFALGPEKHIASIGLRLQYSRVGTESD